MIDVMRKLFGRQYPGFKARIDHLPGLRPGVEVFVYSPWGAVRRRQIGNLGLESTDAEACVRLIADQVRRCIEELSPSGCSQPSDTCAGRGSEACA